MHAPLARYVLGLVFALGLVCGSAVAKTVTIATTLFPSTPYSPYQGLSMPQILTTFAVYDPMTVVDGKGQVQPWLAEKWESADAQVWRITLKDGIFFSNGEPLTSEALVASVAHMQTKVGRTETIGASLSQIDTIAVVSPRAVDIRLKERDAMFPIKMASWKIPEPRAWAQVDAGGGFEHAIGTGPFILERIEENRMTFRANPRAWNKPAADGLVFIKLPDQVSRLQAILASTADLAMQLGIENGPDVEAAGGKLATRKSHQIIYLGFTTEHFKDKNSPILSPKVRQALNYAVDKQAIIDSILHGAMKPTGQLTSPGVPGFDPDIKAFPYDPAKAKALLAEAGYADGFPLTLRLAASGSDDDTVVQQVVANLKDVGVRVTVRAMTQAQATPLLFTATLEGEMFLNFGRGLDPLGDYRFRSCLGLTAGKPFHCDAEAMKRVERARQAVSFETADIALREVARREFESPPGILLWQRVNFDAFSPRLPVPAGYGEAYEFLDLSRLAPK